MKNLQKFGIKELNYEEIKSIDAGCWCVVDWDASWNKFMDDLDAIGDAAHGFVDALIGTDSHSV